MQRDAEHFAPFWCLCFASLLSELGRRATTSTTTETEEKTVSDIAVYIFAESRLGGFGGDGWIMKKKRGEMGPRISWRDAKMKMGDDGKSPYFEGVPHHSSYPASKETFYFSSSDWQRGNMGKAAEGGNHNYLYLHFR